MAIMTTAALCCIAPIQAFGVQYIGHTLEPDQNT